MSDLTFMLMGMLDHNESRETYLRAPFSCAGSKSKALDQILPELPYSDCYCEPFGGSGVVLLNRTPSPLEIFNDRYSGIVSFYRVIQDKEKVNQLIDRLEFIIHAREEFLWCKQTWKNCNDDVERAARWYYMVRMSFSQQGRTFARITIGKGSFGSRFNNKLELFLPIHERIKNIQIENLDWRQCLIDFDYDKTVWYIDPPYYQSAQGAYECDIPDSDHEELLHKIFQLKGFVAISSYPNKLYEKFPWTRKKEWKQKVILAPIEVRKKEPVIECLYIKE